MKVLLINPPWLGKAVYPPLGLAYLATVLDANNIENEIMDCESLRLSLEDVKRVVREKNPDVICLTATTPSAESAFKCARAIKEVSSKPVVLGGIHITSLPEETVGRKEIDIGVIGEGEQTFLELVKALDKGKPLRRVRGICFKDKGKLIKTKPRELIEDLDSIPFPARHKLPQGAYIGNPGLPKVGRIATIMTTRGCPYRCTYCSSRVIWKGKLRKRSPGNILDEIEHLVGKYSVRAVMFKDDTFTIDKDRVIEICRGLKKRGLNIIWSCSSRVDVVSKELVHEMAGAGCRLIEFGFESGSQRILDVLKKDATLEQARKAVKWCREEGISMNGFFMLGSPGETEEDIRKTVEFAKELNPDSAQWAITTPYPGSEMFDMFRDKIGRVENWDTFLHVNPLYPGKGAPAILMSDVPPDVLHRYIKEMTKYFTIRPKRIIHNLMKIRSARELYRQVRAGFKLLISGD